MPSVAAPMWNGGNRILASLSPADRAVMMPHLTPVTLESGDVLYRQHGRIEEVWFPDTAVASLLSRMENGAQVEVGTIGNDGIVGLQLFLGVDQSPSEVIAQIPGMARRMSAGDFQAAVAELPALRVILGRTTYAFLAQVSQTASCNRLHGIEQRCARWLLLTHDRVGGADSFPLTHQFLSYMLGVRRAGVTEAMGILAHSGLIRSTVGQVTILDRAGLEASCCECYAVVRYALE